MNTLVPFPNTEANAARLRSRSAEDFERLVLPHRQAALNLARWLLRHDQDAEDCVQEGLFNAYRAFSQFRGEDAKGWLLVIVRRTCYLQLRHRKRAALSTPFDEVVHSQALESRPSEAAGGDALAQGLLPKALDRLPAEARTILVLREMRGLAYEDIRRLMNIPMGTVMSRLYRARHRLQREMQHLLQKTAVFDYGTAAR